MKRTHRGLARLLSAGMSLALLTSLVPGAMAASRNVEYEVDADEVLYLEKEDFDKFVYDETSQGTEVDELWFTSLPSSSKGVLYFDYDGRDEYEVEKRESFTRRDLNSVYTRSGQNSTPNSNATNLHSSQKRCCSFCISSSNASPTFQVQKSIFHQMTKPIQVTVILPLLLAISFSRNDDIHSSISGISNDLIGVIPTIGQ